MFNKTKTLAVALSLFALPATAFAQTTIGTVQVSDQGLPYVIDYCQDLADLDAADRYDHDPSLAASVASGISLKTVQFDDCQRAGLI